MGIIRRDAHRSRIKHPTRKEYIIISSGIAKKLTSIGSSVYKTSRSDTSDYTLDFFDVESIEKCVHDIKESAVKLDGIALVIPRIAPGNEVFPAIKDWEETFKHYLANSSLKCNATPPFLALEIQPMVA